jgi:5'-nucleotidase
MGDVLGAEEDHGDVLVVKSGTDFRDLSAITLELDDAPASSVRNKLIRRITGTHISANICNDTGYGLDIYSGTRHTIAPSYRSSPTLKKLLKTLLDSVSSTLKAPVCQTTVTIDVRSQFIRTAEVCVFPEALRSITHPNNQSAAGNWFADIIRHAYDDALCMKGCGGSDGVFICAGTLRGDSTYGPGSRMYYIFLSFT